MDPRSIYAGGTHNLGTVSWVRESSETEWIYTGDATEFQEDEVQGRIDEWFADELIYLVVGRLDSCSIERRAAARRIPSALTSTPTVRLVDHSFRRFAEFNEAGVMRLGQKDS